MSIDKNLKLSSIPTLLTSLKSKILNKFFTKEEIDINKPFGRVYDTELVTISEYETIDNLTRHFQWNSSELGEFNPDYIYETTVYHDTLKRKTQTSRKEGEVYILYDADDEYAIYNPETNLIELTRTSVTKPLLFGNKLEIKALWRDVDVPKKYLTWVDETLEYIKSKLRDTVILPNYANKILTLPVESGHTVRVNIPDEQINSDWNQSNTNSKDYIKNRPFYFEEGDENSQLVSISALDLYPEGTTIGQITNEVECTGVFKWDDIKLNEFNTDVPYSIVPYRESTIYKKYIEDPETGDWTAVPDDYSGEDCQFYFLWGYTEEYEDTFFVGCLDFLAYYLLTGDISTINPIDFDEEDPQHYSYLDRVALKLNVEFPHADEYENYEVYLKKRDIFDNAVYNYVSDRLYSGAIPEINIYLSQLVTPTLFTEGYNGWYENSWTLWYYELDTNWIRILYHPDSNCIVVVQNIDGLKYNKNNLLIQPKNIIHLIQDKYIPPTTKIIIFKQDESENWLCSEDYSTIYLWIDSGFNVIARVKGEANIHILTKKGIDFLEFSYSDGSSTLNEGFRITNENEIIFFNNFLDLDLKYTDDTWTIFTREVNKIGYYAWSIENPFFGDDSVDSFMIRDAGDYKYYGWINVPGIKSVSEGSYYQIAYSEDGIHPHQGNEPLKYIIGGRFSGYDGRWSSGNDILIRVKYIKPVNKLYFNSKQQELNKTLFIDSLNKVTQTKIYSFRLSDYKIISPGPYDKYYIPNPVYSIEGNLIKWACASESTPVSSLTFLDIPDNWTGEDTGTNFEMDINERNIRINSNGSSIFNNNYMFYIKVDGFQIGNVETLYFNDGNDIKIIPQSNQSITDTFTDWSLEKDFSKYKRIKCYVTAGISSGNITPTTIVEIPLDAPTYNNLYTGSTLVPYLNNSNRLYSVGFCVDLTKTKLLFLFQYSLYGTAATSAIDQNRYLYKVEGYYE